MRPVSKVSQTNTEYFHNNSPLKFKRLSTAQDQKVAKDPAVQARLNSPQMMFKNSATPGFANSYTAVDNTLVKESYGYANGYKVQTLNVVPGPTSLVNIGVPDDRRFEPFSLRKMESIEVLEDSPQVGKGDKNSGRQMKPAEMNQFKMTSHQFDYRAKGNPFQSKQITSMLDLEQAYRRPISLEITRDMALASHADAERKKKISK